MIDPPPCPDEMGNVITKCVINVEGYTQYNSYELIIQFCRAHVLQGRLYENSRKMARIYQKSPPNAHSDCHVAD